MNNTKNEIVVTTEFEGRRVTAEFKIIDCLWNSAMIHNIVNGILLSAKQPSFMESGEADSPIFQVLCVAEPRLTLIAEYWSLYRQGLKQDLQEEKEATARRMKEIQKQLGVEDYPSSYFNPIERMLSFYRQKVAIAGDAPAK